MVMIGLQYFIINTGINQVAIAQELDVTPSLITKWVKDVKQLTPKHAILLENILQADRTLFIEDLDLIIINPEHDKYKILCESIKRSKIARLEFERNKIDKEIIKLKGEE
jgi:transcriptional regulator with XRE-family HTH domain